MKKISVLISALVMSMLMFIGCSTPNNDKPAPSASVPNGSYEILEAKANDVPDPDKLVGIVLPVENNSFLFNGYWNKLNADGTITPKTSSITNGKWKYENETINFTFTFTDPQSSTKYDYFIKAKLFELTPENSKSTVTKFNAPSALINKTINLITDVGNYPLEMKITDNKAIITSAKNNDFAGTYTIYEIDAKDVPTHYTKTHYIGSKYYILSIEVPTSVDLSCNKMSVKADKGADFIFVAEEFSNNPDENVYYINGKAGLAFIR